MYVVQLVLTSPGPPRSLMICWWSADFFFFASLHPKCLFIPKIQGERLTVGQVDITHHLYRHHRGGGGGGKVSALSLFLRLWTTLFCIILTGWDYSTLKFRPSAARPIVMQEMSCFAALRIRSRHRRSQPSLPSGWKEHCDILKGPILNSFLHVEYYTWTLMELLCIVIYPKKTPA